jgi:hypothetical protein
VGFIGGDLVHPLTTPVRSLLEQQTKQAANNHQGNYVLGLYQTQKLWRVLDFREEINSLNK